MCRCPCGCEFEVRAERAVVLRCPECGVVVVARDMETAERMLADKVKGMANGDESDGEGGAAAPGGEKA